MRSFLRMPSPGAPPAETLRWVRRAEITYGVGALVGAALAWAAGASWLPWLFLVVGLWGLSPVPGVSRAARRASTEPLPQDPDSRERRRQRARSTTVRLAVGLVAFGAVLGYVVDGAVAAAFMVVLSGASAAASVSITMRRYRDPD